MPLFKKEKEPQLVKLARLFVAKRANIAYIERGIRTLQNSIELLQAKINVESLRSGEETESLASLKKEIIKAMEGE